MWKKELGIRVNIENQEWKVYLKNAEMMNFSNRQNGLDWRLCRSLHLPSNC